MTKLSIHDFTVTLDTRESKGSKVVLHLDREGQPRLTIACGAEQLLWVCEDDDYFAQGYRSTIARTIVELHAGQFGEEWTFELIARELGVTVAQAVQIHDEAVAETAELAEVGS